MKNVEERRGEIAATQRQRQSQEESIIIDGVVKNDEVFFREKVIFGVVGMAMTLDSRWLPRGRGILFRKWN